MIASDTSAILAIPLTGPKGRRRVSGIDSTSRGRVHLTGRCCGPSRQL